MADEESTSAIEEIVAEGNKIVNDLGTQVYQNAASSVIFDLTTGMYSEMQVAAFIQCRQSNRLNDTVFDIYEKKIDKYIDFLYSFLPPDGNSAGIIRSIAQEQKITSKETVDQLDCIAKEMFNLEKDYVKKTAELQVSILFLDKNKTEKYSEEVKKCNDTFTELITNIIKVFTDFCDQKPEDPMAMLFETVNSIKGNSSFLGGGF